MNSFIEKHVDLITGVLSGFDRLVFHGALRSLSITGGMMDFLWRTGVLLKDFGSYVERTSLKLKTASLAEAKVLNRPVKYLASSSADKEKIAREIMESDKIENGLICVLKSVEVCQSYEVYRNKEEKKLELQPRKRKCLHFYHYWIDNEFGFMSARIQTWFPFRIQVCLNGREWLSHQLDKAGISHLKSDNCFLNIGDMARAQELMEEQVRLNWENAMNKVATRLNPAFNEIFSNYKISYYWTIYQSEWATDILFKSPAALASIYPQLVRGAMACFSSPDVMRFLGSKKFHGNFKGEVISDYKKRSEGIRVKHRVNNNSVKMYDKKGHNLRIETTINNPRDFMVNKPAEELMTSEGKEKPKRRRMRKGVSDIYHRVQASRACNNRYLNSLQGLNTEKTIKDLIDPVCESIEWKGRKFRGMRLWKTDESKLLAAISRGEFCINGFRNRQLVEVLYPHIDKNSNKKERKSVASAITRKIQILRAHGLIRKMPNSYRYVLSKKGNEIIPAVLGYLITPSTKVYQEAA